MQTTTAPRIISDKDAAYLIDSSVSVVCNKHDWADQCSAGVLRVNDILVSIHASDNSEHATFYMTPDEARLFAQAILDVLA